MLPWPRRKRRASRTPTPAPDPAPDPGHRIYAVGDVHGRHDLLAALLARIEADAAAHEDGRLPILVFLGDLVDRGDHSREALDLALRAQRRWPRTVVLRGNHEAALLDFLEEPERSAAWLGFGGRQTLASYGVPAPNADAEPPELHAAAEALAAALEAHARLLQETDLMFRSGDVVFAHSGIDPARPLDAQGEGALLWGRSAFLEAGPPEGLRVVHGHWADPEPTVTPARINVDTGAYYTGRLTAVRLDDETALIAVDGLDL